MRAVAEVAFDVLWFVVVAAAVMPELAAVL